MSVVNIRDAAAVRGQLQNPTKSIPRSLRQCRNAQVGVVPRATFLSTEGVAKGSNGRVWVIDTLHSSPTLTWRFPEIGVPINHPFQ